MCISPLFLCLIIFGLHAGIAYELFCVFMVAFLHECGHMLTAMSFGVKIKGMKIKPWGVCMEAESFPSIRAECLTALAGPIVNVILLGVQFFWKNDIFMTSNLFMLLVNILPVLPLDGGRMMKAILAGEVGARKSDVYMAFLSKIFSVVLFGIGVVLFYKTGVNFSVILIAVFVACTVSEKSVHNKVKTHDLQIAEHYIVLAENKAVEMLKRGIKKERAVLDLVAENGRYIGSLTYYEVLEEIANYGYEIKFAEILQKQLQKQEFCSTIDNV